ncbi:hypothetical protein M0805_002758 [Coniferiporia weirii]|nr:hypothetical protein M0805_002758 [Coniferiporia weirii]
MAVAARDAGEQRKKKTPPTFQHLPQNRAAKLKKEWVERQKLKSKWKAQKRKDGPLPPHIPDTEQHDNDDEVYPNSAGESSDADADDDDDDEEPERSGVSRKRARAVRSPSPPRMRSKKADAPPSPSPPSSEAEDGQKPASASALVEPKPSLRELTRQAYSRESLHTFRADPLHRRRGAASSSSTKMGAGARGARGGGRGRGAGPGQRDRGGPMRGGRGRGRGGGRDGGPARGGRGQPNMKLRMEAMLERIKQDHT